MHLSDDNNLTVKFSLLKAYLRCFHGIKFKIGTFAVVCKCIIIQIRVRTGKLFFLFLNQNIYCGYSKEPSQ